MKHPVRSGMMGCCVLLAGTLAAVHAQIVTIPKDGLPGLSKEAQEFEIEHNYRRENNLGGTVPAEPGTRPGSMDPQNIEGIWLKGRTYNIAADGSFTLQVAGAAAQAERTRQTKTEEPVAVPQSTVPCLPRLQFALGMPSKIVQTEQALYIFRNGQDGATYRRILMNASLPAKVTPTFMGYSVGRWQNDTLIVQTTGVRKPATAAYGDNLSYDETSLITERIRKIEGGLMLEDIISVATPGQAGAQSIREVSYYRPDLQYVEAPCEEYSDPFEGQYQRP